LHTVATCKGKTKRRPTKVCGVYGTNGSPVYFSQAPEVYEKTSTPAEAGANLPTEMDGCLSVFLFNLFNLGLYLIGAWATRAD